MKKIGLLGWGILAIALVSCVKKEAIIHEQHEINGTADIEMEGKKAEPVKSKDAIVQIFKNKEGIEQNVTFDPTNKSMYVTIDGSEVRFSQLNAWAKGGLYTNGKDTIKCDSNEMTLLLNGKNQVWKAK